MAEMVGGAVAQEAMESEGGGTRGMAMGYRL